MMARRCRYRMAMDVGCDDTAADIDTTLRGAKHCIALWDNDFDCWQFISATHIEPVENFCLIGERPS